MKRERSETDDSLAASSSTNEFEGKSCRKHQILKIISKYLKAGNQIREFKKSHKKY